MIKLRRYNRIAWDFDGTLIDHRNAMLFHRFILTHPEVEHVIVTFRSHGQQHDMFDELAQVYRHAPKRHHFTSIFNLSDLAWQQVKLARYLRMVSWLHRRRPLSEAEEYFVCWKGMVCNEQAIPVLIDDRREDVLPGCQKHGIQYYHPNDFRATEDEQAVVPNSLPAAD